MGNAEEQPMKTITSVEAQNKFGKLLDTVQREPISITRHGRPTAFFVSPMDMEELLDSRRKRSKAVAEFEAWRVETLRRTTPEAAELAAKLSDEEVVRLVHELS